MENLDSTAVFAGVERAVEAWVASCAKSLAADKALKTYPKIVENPVITDWHGIVAYEHYLADRDANLIRLEAEYREADRERQETFSALYAAIPFYKVWFKTNLGYVRKISGIPHLQYKSIEDVMAEVTKKGIESGLPF